jgi:hypothetical protein
MGALVARFAVAAHWTLMSFLCEFAGGCLKQSLVQLPRRQLDQKVKPALDQVNGLAEGFKLLVIGRVAFGRIVKHPFGERVNMHMDMESFHGGLPWWG